MSNADEIARRAEEIIARAQRIAEDASDADALREELDRLDAELAQLDEEQQRLDEDMLDRGDPSSNESTRTSESAPWTEAIADIVADVTERLGSLGGGWPWRSSETIERTVPITEQLPVVIESRGGSIKVEEGAAGAVGVTAEMFAPSQGLLEEMTLTAENEGSQVTIRAHWPEQRRGRRARLTVTVPVETPIRASTSGGAVTVTDTRGAATVSTRGGSITIDGTRGDVDARTKGGSVRITNQDGAVHASTMGGSVHITGALRGVVEASTAGGSIHVDGADGATVNASTSGGSIDVRGRLTGHTRIRTAGGSVKVTIPPDSQVHVDGKGSNSSSDFADLEATRGRIQGTLGDGHEGTIEFKTSGGSVSLRKS